MPLEIFQREVDEASVGINRDSATMRQEEFAFQRTAPLPCQASGRHVRPPRKVAKSALGGGVCQSDRHFGLNVCRGPQPPSLVWLKGNCTYPSIRTKLDAQSVPVGTYLTYVPVGTLQAICSAALRPKS